jgi:hypothetical protein
MRDIPQRFWNDVLSADRGERITFTEYTIHYLDALERWRIPHIDAVRPRAKPEAVTG